MARPSKRTPEREARIIEVLRAGNTRRAACAYASIDQVTFERWLARFADFADAVKKAESDAEVRNVAIIQQAAAKSWQAAAWWLERRKSDDWRERKDVDTKGEVNVKVVYANLGSDTDAAAATPSPESVDQ